jgi:hypothetical protein
VEDVIPKLMDVEAEPPCGATQAVVLALEVPIASVDDPHELKMLTVAVLIRSAYDVETIAILRNAIAKNRRMASSGAMFIHPARLDFNFQVEQPNSAVLWSFRNRFLVEQVTDRMVGSGGGVSFVVEEERLMRPQWHRCTVQEVHCP